MKNKRKVIYNIAYYLAVPTLFLLSIKLFSFMLPENSSLGTIITATYGLIYIIIPIVAVVLMRFSLLPWIVDPFAAVEIPLALFTGMIVNIMNRSQSGSIISALRELNNDLSDDGGLGYLFFIALYVFCLISTISFKRKRGNFLNLFKKTVKT